MEAEKPFRLKPCARCGHVHPIVKFPLGAWSFRPCREVLGTLDCDCNHRTGAAVTVDDEEPNPQPYR